MALYVSLSVFSNLESGTPSSYTVPNYLECCGILLSDDPSSACIHSMLPDEVVKDGFHIFKWNAKPEVAASLQESVQRFRGIIRDGKLELVELPLNDITWVDNDTAECARRGYIPCAATLVAEVPLPLDQSVELSHDVVGDKRLEDVYGPLKLVVMQFLKEGVIKFLDTENEALSIDITDVRTAKQDPKVVDVGYSNLTFGVNSGYSKHILLYSATTDDGTNHDENAQMQLIWQTTLVLPTELFGEESNEKVGEEAIVAFRHLAKMAYSSPGHNDMRLLITPHEKHVKNEDEQLITASKSVPKSKNASKGGKGKNSGSRTRKPQTQHHAQTQQTTTIDILQSNTPIKIAIGNSQRDIYLAITLDKTTGKMTVRADDTASTPTMGKVEMVKVYSIFKTFLPGTGERDPIIPSCGVSLSLLNIVSHGDHSLEECIPQPHPGKHVKMLINSKDMCNKDVLVEPHMGDALFPQWMSNKTSRASVVKGYYQYYHYMQVGGLLKVCICPNQCGKNDNGWGCCYRSIQMMASWYLLQYYTLKRVPTHEEIQKYLKERDPSHAELVVGSTTWIGTVEAGYFINWYLNYNSKSYYINDVNDMRNYNGVIANHFLNVGSPIIMGAGMFAYVIAGICIGAQPDDVAYLIADPHYTGEDNVKSIKTKGAISWKKIDFIAKAASGGFINLCCPQIEPYEE
ncbi:protein of unknown function (DUF1671) protein family [Babesia divergens]|uniref:UFSP1/2/DUB catalytic domain-containing protein n=1 Tax=Babesia divergens TaxID=32595 RepID=A0AAD9LFG2_BABDI|nr:protein of unknown function (DUF1671) protein family [Babesia divergens]